MNQKRKQTDDSRAKRQNDQTQSFLSHREGTGKGKAVRHQIEHIDKMSVKEKPIIHGFTLPIHSFNSRKNSFFRGLLTIISVSFIRMESPFAPVIYDGLTKV